MKKRLFINIHYLEIGGAERALLGLLSALDPNKVEIDLFVNQHTGEFMSLIPDYVNLLPEIPEYTCIERPIKDILKEGHFCIAVRRLLALWEHKKYIKGGINDNGEHYTSFFQYVADSVDGALRSLKFLGEYDLAISFLHPHNIVLHKVKAKKKICWIHTDYSTIHVNKEKELKIWKGYDKIISISDECAIAFIKTFPELSDKVMVIENILSPNFIKNQANIEEPNKEIVLYRENGNVINILSIGRFHPAKNFECIPNVCAELEKQGVNFRWYVIGYGPDKKIQDALDKFNMRHRMILLGKKSNPYPYIKACDIYVQPSKYEGKSVTVREAQILRKPVVITNYPTAKSQVKDGVDGIIVENTPALIAKGIVSLINDIPKRKYIEEYLSKHDYGNEKEVEKIYNMI